MDESVCAELSSDAVLELVKKEADAILQKNCIDPFDTVVQKQVPYMTVSSEFRIARLYVPCQLTTWIQFY